MQKQVKQEKITGTQFHSEKFEQLENDKKNDIYTQSNKPVYFKKTQNLSISISLCPSEDQKTAI